MDTLLMVIAMGLLFWSFYGSATSLLGKYMKEPMSAPHNKFSEAVRLFDFTQLCAISIALMLFQYEDAEIPQWLAQTAGWLYLLYGTIPGINGALAALRADKIYGYKTRDVFTISRIYILSPQTWPSERLFHKIWSVAFGIMMWAITLSQLYMVLILATR